MRYGGRTGPVNVALFHKIVYEHLAKLLGSQRRIHCRDGHTAITESLFWNWCGSLSNSTVLHQTLMEKSTHFMVHSSTIQLYVHYEAYIMMGSGATGHTCRYMCRVSTLEVFYCRQDLCSTNLTLLVLTTSLEFIVITVNM